MLFREVTNLIQNRLFDLCFSELETDSRCVGLSKKKIPKECWGNRKKYPWAESKICVFKSLCVCVCVCVCVCMCVCVTEREKITALVSLQSILRYQIPYSKRILKVQNFWPKHHFSFTLETVLKWQRKQGSVESISARLTKYGSKKVPIAEVNLNCSLWIDYKQLIMDCFDCIFISTEDLAYFTLIFSPWFHDCSISCSTCTKSTKSIKSNGNISKKWAKVLYFVLEKVLFYRQVMRNSDAKKYFNSRKKYFLVWYFIENQVFKISTLFLCFSVFSLFKLM